MIFVEQNDDLLEVNFKPVRYHLDRIKQVLGAKFEKGLKLWTVPVECLDELEDQFKGEIIWVTPRHQITGEPAPPPPAFWSKIPLNQVPNLKLQLYPFQVFGAQFLAYSAQHNDGIAFLGDQMGIGKTFQSIAGAELLRNQGLVSKTLIVCLSPLKQQWAEEGVEALTHASTLVISGTPAKRQKLYAEIPNVDYVITSYELILKDIDVLKELEKNGVTFDLIIFDEAHKMKNRLGKTNNAAAKLNIPYKFFLSGTPLMNKPEEIYGLFQVANPKVFGKFTEFKKRHLNYQYNGNFLDLVGYKNLDEVREKFGHYFLRRTDKEVAMDLPDVTEKNEYVEMTPFQKKMNEQLISAAEDANKKALNAIRNPSLTEEEKKAMQGAAQGLMNLRIALCDSPELFTMSSSANIRKNYGEIVENTKGGKVSPKLERLLDMVEEMLENGEKVVIFTQFKRMAQILYREIKKRTKKNVVAYYGGLSEEERDKRLKMFKTRADCPVFVSTESGSTGLNLQFAKYLINYDLPWNPAIWNQRKGRIRRLGSSYKKVQIINLLVRDSIDEVMYATLEKKQNVFNALIENDSRQSKRLSKLSNKAGK